MGVLLTTDFPDLRLAARGKVRDVYDLDGALLIVTTDRISAFDVVMAEGIPEKGRVLTRISKYWFQQTKDIIPNHLVSTEVGDYPAACRKYADVLEGRSMLVRKASPLPVECIVRGYLSGSGWKEYLRSKTVCGIPLPEGLLESARLDEPLFTPSTKAEQGAHDENITFAQCVELVGAATAEKLRDVTIAIYRRARDIAAAKGIIIADTKFEYGICDGELILIDECLTPDSSRFWPSDAYRPGGAQPSFDKQYLRDYLETLDWGKCAPPPALPDEIVCRTGERYLEALARLAGPG